MGGCSSSGTLGNLKTYGGRTLSAISISASRGRLVPAIDDVLTGLVVLVLTGLEGVSSFRLFVAVSHEETACYDRLTFV